MRDRLTPFQRELVETFSGLAPEFFLTGGAALAGYHLGHRETQDLDLFVEEDHLEQGTSALRVAADRLGAEVESLQTSPTFRRLLVRRGTESIVVDLVLDPTPQGGSKPVLGGVRVDPPEEILANKLCALLSRAEIRDLVDVRALEAAGHSLQDALALGARKDGGLTPGQLGWVLSQVRIGPDAAIPGGVSGQELAAYLTDLRSRLERLAHPG